MPLMHFLSAHIVDKSTITTNRFRCSCDLPSSCRIFSGSNSYSVSNFFREALKIHFFCFRILLISKIIFLQNGSSSAKLRFFSLSQRNLNSYAAFNAALINAFSVKMTSIRIHKQLERQKMPYAIFSCYVQNYTSL